MQKTAVEDINLDRDNIGLEAASSIVIDEVKYEDKQSEGEYYFTKNNDDEDEVYSFKLNNGGIVMKVKGPEVINSLL